MADDTRTYPEPKWRNTNVAVALSQAHWQQIFDFVISNPQVLYQSPTVRSRIGLQRLEKVDTEQIKTFGENPKSAIDKTIQYNIEVLKSGEALGRPNLLINVLTSIDLIRFRIGDLKVLTIGPRSEVEIMSLLAAGFSPNRIRGLDLFSYSDFVDVGDMHDMPYKDNSFDVVILGWVLAYSRDNAQVAREVRRVTTPGGFVAVGCQYVPYTREQLKELDGDRFLDPTRFYSADDILDLWKGQISFIPFRHDIHPTMKDRQGDVMAVFQFDA